jgi:TFIIF-interacting CTD phosphatase-like protein
MWGYPDPSGFLARDRMRLKIFLCTSLGGLKMGGRGPAPKSSKIRQRRNKKSGATNLSSTENTKDVKRKIPKLQNPDNRNFHKLTKDWWKRVWNSPMAGEYLPTDVDGLARLAILIDNYYHEPVAKNSKEIMGEIRLQEARFGLSPVDRSRLQWEIQKGEEAEKKRGPKKSSTPSHHADPRGILGVAK